MSFIFFLSWTPILLIFVLAVFFRASALKLSAWGLLYTLFLAGAVFGTAPGVMALAGLDGMLTTVPLLLVVYFGILLSLFLIEKGSLQRLAGWFDAAGKLNPVTHGLLLSFGVGNFLEGAGIIAEPVAAPMLLAAGIRPTAAAILSISGYAGLMHLSLAGVIVTVLAAVTDLPTATLAWDLGILSFPATLFFALSVPWVVRAHVGWPKNLPTLVATGLLAAGTALVAARFVAVSIAGMLAGIAVVAFFSCLTRHLPRLQPSLAKDLAPFLFIFSCLAAVNLIPPLRHLCRDELVIAVRLVPGHTVFLRPLFDAYFYLFFAFLLANRLHAAPGDSIGKAFRTGNRKAIAAVAAIALFGATGQIIAYSGYGEGFSHFDPGHNIALCLANGLITCTGKAYPVFAPLLGWVGTFLTGYGLASVMLFGKLQLQTAQMLGISPSLLACALTVGASIGSVSSPFKVALAAPLCGAAGREGEILRATIPFGLAASFATGVVTLLLTWL